MAERGKLLKKIRRKQAQFRTSELEMVVTFLDDFSANDEVAIHHFFIGNGGIRNGLSSEVLAALLDGIDSLYMPESRDFSFASVTGRRKATRLLKHCNGLSIQDTCRARNITHLLSPALLQGPPLHLYLCLVEKIPETLQKYDVPHGLALPPGLILIPGFVSLSEERELLDHFTTPPSGDISDHSLSISPPSATVNLQEGLNAANIPNDTRAQTEPEILPVSSTLRHRRVRHYGYEFLYGKNTVDPSLPLPGGLPGVCAPLIERMMSQELLQWAPDQLTVNDYLPGAGIPPHVDTHSPFEDRIASLSLGSQVVMDFRHPDGRKVAVFLPRRSLLVMSGESRYLWSHGITQRKVDEVHHCMPGYHEESSDHHCQSSSDTFTVVPRGRRVSLTFRKVKRSPCACKYPSKCDSQQQQQEP